MQEAETDTKIIHLGYAFGFKTPAGAVAYLAESYWDFSTNGCYVKSFGPEEFFSPLVGAYRYDDMNHVRAHLGDLFDLHVTQDRMPELFDATQPAGLNKSDRRTNYRYEKPAPEEIIVAQFELALRPANPHFVSLVMNKAMLSETAYRMGYSQNAGILDHDDMEAFRKSVSEDPPIGFEKAGYLVVNRQSMQTENPKYIEDYPLISRPGVDLCERNIILSELEKKSTFRHSNIFKQHLALLGCYAPLVLPPNETAQVMRAGVRVTPLLPVHAGLIYEYENARASDKISADESQRGIDAALNLSRHLYRMNRQANQPALRAVS